MTIPDFNQERPPLRFQADGRYTATTGTQVFAQSPILGICPERWAYGFEIGDSDFDSVLIEDAEGHSYVLATGCPVQGPLKGPFRFIARNNLAFIPKSASGSQSRYVSASQYLSLRCQLEVIIHFRPIVHSQIKRPMKRERFPGTASDSTVVNVGVTSTSYLADTGNAVPHFATMGRKRGSVAVKNAGNDDIIAKLGGARHFIQGSLWNGSAYPNLEVYYPTATTDVTVPAGGGKLLEWGEEFDFIVLNFKRAGVGTTGILTAICEARDD